MLMQKLRFQSFGRITKNIVSNQFRYFSHGTASSSSSTTTTTETPEGNIGKDGDDDRMLDFSSLDLRYKLDDTKILPRQYKNWAPLPEKLPESLPFAVCRSKNGCYPVYTDIYGGDKKCTIIRKISGDVLVLKEELEKVTWGKEVLVRAGHLRINGQWKWRIVNYLHKLGF